MGSNSVRNDFFYLFHLVRPTKDTTQRMFFFLLPTAVQKTHTLDTVQLCAAR